MAELTRRQRSQGPLLQGPIVDGGSEAERAAHAYMSHHAQLREFYDHFQVMS